jgi:hypothetical protein
MRVKPRRSAADIFREIGPWEGESAADLMERLDAVKRRHGGGVDDFEPAPMRYRP